MNQRLLITGSSGLLGTALSRALAAQGIEVEGLDLRATGPAQGDIRDLDRVRRALRGTHGILHFAALSRVLWGEQDPDTCHSTNLGGLQNLLATAAASPERPFLLFASSREVYGQPEQLPATEDTPLRPLNTYGHTKAAGERLVTAARQHGLRTAIVRLSNVYGSPDDHPDRVVPAFARAALEGRELRLDGPRSTFDFTHLNDVTRALLTLTDLLRSREPPPPPIHLVSGTPTSLATLATLAISLAGTRAPLRESPPRTFDVAHFHGDPRRAQTLLGWTPEVPLRDGLHDLITSLRARQNTISKHPAPTIDPPGGGPC